MLFPQRFWAPIRDGEVTLAFRRWRSPRARPGSRHRTPFALIEIDQVDSIQPDDIDDLQLRSAGYGAKSELLADLRGDESVPISRIQFHVAMGPDGRAELADDAALTPEGIAAIHGRLARFDAASPVGPWTTRTLRIIEARPHTRAADLAQELGRERLEFKADVRKLKALGLTISHEIGYELSPRGRAFLEADAAPGEP